MGSAWTRWGIVLGVALGGFFDGILLHQILQWHHLLSLVPGITDLRTQILWDGWFHAAMYVLAALALWGLWRDRRRGGALLGPILAGFGVWHVADSVLSHWLLGIHRIRVDSDDPLMWDLIWFAAFGLLPLAAGWLLMRRGGGPRLRGPATAAVLMLGAGTAAAGVWAMKGPPDQRFTTAVFAPHVSPAAMLAAIAEAEGRLVWTDSAGVAVVELPAERRWTLYRRGALLVSGAGAPAGCFAWSRT